MGWFGNGVSAGLLRERVRKLATTTNEPDLRRLLTGLCLEAPPSVLRRIDIARLETVWNAPRQRIIPFFLHAAKSGILDMHYILHCPHCTARVGAPHLHSFRHEMTCPSCKRNVEPRIDSAVEATFSIHPNLAQIKADLTPSTESYIPAIEVINTEEFRTLFETEKPLPGEHLPVNSLYVMFTDLAGSTATYERLGDGPAFGIVRDHFTILFDAVKKHNGAIVKTIGDAIMATFLRPADAIACALESREQFCAFNKRDDVNGAAGLKVGVHGGPCLAVTLNQRLDFFGSTINKAARIQGVAEKNQICMSRELASDITVKPLLKGKKIRNATVTLKGIITPVEIVCVK